MSEKNNEFVAVLYKSTKNNVFIANCYAMNVAGYGKTEETALQNLQKTLTEICGENEITISVLSELKVCSC